MTAWWKTTARVRKVRARSSAALRAVALGAVRTSAFATDEEIEVMRAPAGDHLRCCRREPDSARAQGPKSWFSRPDRPRSFLKPLSGRRSSGKARQIVDFGQRG